MDIKSAIRQLMQCRDLSTEEMTGLMREIMGGQMTDAQIAAFLVALEQKGVSSGELQGAVTVMRELLTPVEIAERKHLVDTCGTGGSGSDTFNVSTSAALVAACAGARVAKHGNRSATSKSGSADVLEAAGVDLGIGPDGVAECINRLGVGFLFAPAHHSAMKHVIGPRREIGIPTIFNLLGPLTNPAFSPNQVLGVPDAVWIPRLLDALQGLGSGHILVVSSEDGLDEISIAADTHVGELRDGIIHNYTISPEDFGIRRYEDYSMLQIADAHESLVLMRKALNYEHQAAGDIVALNAGAAIFAAGLTGGLVEGVSRAQEILHSGQALQKLDELARLSSSLGNAAGSSPGTSSGGA